MTGAPLAEVALLSAALGCYAAALAAGGRGWVLAGGGRVRGLRGLRDPAALEHAMLALLWLALMLHAASLGARWVLLGHGPFTTLYEILSSNVWSLALCTTLLAQALPAVRAALPLALLPVAVLALWMLAADASPGHLPPTYATALLYLHALTGKAFLGLLLAALGVAALPWLRRLPRLNGAALTRLPLDAALAELAARLAAAAFVFDTLMLVVGAAWAQDAWGRYWAWDPLETWAFITWVALAIVLHARGTWRLPPAALAPMLFVVFVLAFLTFFGVPFVSTSPHKGAI
jgi:ABC-type transport system involved in cytochrome c biogenesis permease subunit